MSGKSDSQEEIRRLTEELEIARYHIVGLAIDGLGLPVQEVWREFTSCRTSGDVWGWESRWIKAVIAVAKRHPKGDLWCPLCRSGVSSWGEEDVRGFTHVGLGMHLRGEGRAHRCIVFEAARKLALGIVRERSAKASSVTAAAMVAAAVAAD